MKQHKPGRPPRGPVLVVNAGSTSLKLSVVEEDERSQPVASLDALPDDVAAVAHRIVHLGGLELEAAAVDDSVLAAVERGAEVAPLHNVPALRALERARAALPRVPHVVVSDAHFHRTLPPEAREYALPRELRERWGIVRHGFHGLAVASVAEQVRVPRLVVCHLGGGCSVTAVRDGRSVETTMGFTPLEGPPMGTRSGSIDPGALLYLIRRGITADDLDRTLNEESGLVALGGLDDPFALRHFTYHIAAAAAAMAAALGGLDAIAFSGGIGENRPDVRDAVAGRLRFLGEFTVEVRAPREDVIAARSARAALHGRV